jgi:hypothetical protein
MLRAVVGNNPANQIHAALSLLFILARWKGWRLDTSMAVEVPGHTRVSCHN